MNTILTQIINKIKTEEEKKWQNFNADDFTLTRTQAPIDIIPIDKNRFFVIAEIKKKSPSRGIIRSPFEPLDIAQMYELAGASAISVITESQFFAGKKKYLSQVKKLLHLPVLRKDFIIHPYQIYESYNLEADFILLIASCLPPNEISHLSKLARRLGMRVLVEVHTQQELDGVLPLNPDLIGINNRNLDTFKVDLNTSFFLKPLIPDSIPVISESGIKTHLDIQHLQEHGFAGVLIGESLLREEDIVGTYQRIIYGKD